ncbi:MAG: hypothetical protein KIS96_08575 [Bauldia sp.]|nr:hypothetical protein [Bauldia sp.]
MKIIGLLAAVAALSVASVEVQAQQLRAAGSDPLRPVIGNLVLDMNPQADKCYNIDANGNKVEVRCPDVIVAKPDSNQQQRSEDIAALVSRGQVVSPAAVRGLATAEVPVDKGTYNCYNERPPNSGNFEPVTCPDIIVITTND